jgi:tetratricopeptide (TPR) repeat protein
MAIFKCKICGGTLEIDVGETVATCEYCGTKQTLPKLDDEKKAHLFERANHFRRNNDFDKAMSIYEQILNDDAEDAESYWSIVLCRYGIEYVEDPSAHKRVPTVNRAQFTSVFDDEDYKSAIKYADSYQKSIYEQEARTINEIQKGILEISGQEEPFDVFICYKETDNNGRRTQDSVLATELYNELTREGFKVFFSRITLEDRLGTAYEPYIFAALNSSKVMVVLGTRPEYFNAVWVKNEWSRYLALIKNGARKMLVPAYRDMNPYDLPEEFSHLQAQDMTKLGFMQDLVRGIKKLVSADSSSGVKETVVVQGAASGNASALVKRGFLALEDEEWEKADEFFEQALNQNAEDAQAYLGKLMAEFKCHTPKEISKLNVLFTQSKNYEKVVRYGNEALVSELKEYEKSVKDNQSHKIYESALKIMGYAETEEEFEEAIHKLNSIKAHKDALTKIEECKKGILKLQNEAVERRKAKIKKQEEIDKKVKKNRIIGVVIIAVTIILNFIVGPAFWPIGIIGAIIFFVRANSIKNGSENNWKYNQYNAINNYNSLNNRRKFK